MIKKVMLFILSGMMVMNLCGCFALFVGAVGGAGTAVWLSGKLTEEFHASYHATIDASKSALRALDLKVTQETESDNVTQIKGIYSDGREMWIDIHPVTDNSTKLEIRVGGVSSDKEAAGRVLKKIQEFL